MKNKLLFLVISFSFFANYSVAQYTYAKPVEKNEINIDRKDSFEIGFNFGTAWTLGKAKYFAKSGTAFSLDLGVNSNNLYFGTEFTVTSWRDYLDNGDAGDLNFEKTNFLWLIHAKIFLGDGKVKPYFGAGTDLISLALAIILSEDEDDFYYSNCNDDRKLNYNAWFVPSCGIRWEMGPDISGNIGFSANFSDNYDFIRLQLGIVF
ncbi:hypothetical protein BZG02_09635 [Labilibaculum filiforme]|uniref:Outer membrane protein beta-barrel domain-containing protein n=1 Tax=Labilibaculum filiforme TaxID=1940526 RepID=A0A2N3HY94_9BACT|nr:hypothetical protein [Labilibaculum filiforme]PKQ63024.1 hypothetical protein BZG02_09635 [Labilibaculum filiforme]